jgi:hypothetical protein
MSAPLMLKEFLHVDNPEYDFSMFAKLSRTPGRRREPLLVVRGGDKPVWT